MRNSFRVFCFLLNILHIYYLCDEYFRFEVTTNVEIAIPDEITVPAFTMCSPLFDAIKWEDLTSDQRKKLFEGLKDFKPPVDFRPSNIRSLKPSELVLSQISKNLYDLLNTSSIFNQTRDVWEVINGEKVNLFIMKKMALDSLGDLRAFKHTLTFLRENFKCFTLELKEQLGKSLNYDDLLTATNGQLWINQFSLNSYQLPMLLYIHSSDHVITQLHSFKRIEQKSYFAVNFETHTTILLPFPYSSNCKDYSIFGTTSKAHCKEMCMQTRIADKFKVLDAQFHIYASDSYPIRQNLLENEAEGEKIIHHCQRKCWQKDCSSTLFNLATVVNSRAPLSIATIVVSKSPSTRTKAQAAIPFVVFMTNVLSTFGIWLGVSLLGSGREIKRLAKCSQIYDKYQVIKCRFNQAVIPSTTDFDDSRTSSPLFVRRLPNRH